MIAGPTYGSHAEAWTRAGALTQTIGPTSWRARAERAGCLTIVNPNNPDGRIVERARLLDAARFARAHGGTLIVDEAFADVEPEVSVGGRSGNRARRDCRAALVRQVLSAWRACGWASSSPRLPLAATIRGLIGEWPVSSDAIAAGLAAYADQRWKIANAGVLQKAAQRLDHLLARSGFELAGGTSLFRLARAADARERFAQLLAAGILVRPFDFDSRLLRFGLPHGRDQWRRLTAGARQAGMNESSATCVMRRR